mmetsp:Transcript_25274/g.35615  ORF Transcript_25274/g.35615 Transcript_25274/m.35615 type:complete len:104 (+) Transcript_25274:37-348(+)
MEQKKQGHGMEAGPDIESKQDSRQGKALPANLPISPSTQAAANGLPADTEGDDGPPPVPKVRNPLHWNRMKVLVYTPGLTPKPAYDPTKTGNTKRKLRYSWHV